MSLLAVVVATAACGRGRRHTDEATRVVEVTPHAPPLTCYELPVAPVCEAVEPIPSTEARIAQRVRESAVSLRCNDGAGGVVDDLAVLDEAFAGHQVFMMGEVHGTNEVGRLSAMFLRHLVEEHGVTKVAIEAPWEMQWVYDDLLSGSPSSETQDWIASFSVNEFLRILPETARELRAAGHTISVHAIDTPIGTLLPITGLEEIAASLGANRYLLTDGMPEGIWSPGDFTFPYVENTQAYADRVLDDMGVLCTELTAEECERLEIMTKALWVAVSLYLVDIEEWLAVREQVIYYGLTRQFDDDPTTKLYMHMGAFHTNELSASAGSQLANEFEITRGKTFSIATAWGEGSEIRYGGETLELPADPLLLAGAFGSAAVPPQFIYTRAPLVSCEANPLGLEPSHLRSGGAIGEAYDAMAYYHRLTPHHLPHLSTLSAPVYSWTAQFRAHRAMVTEAEWQVFGR